MKTQLTHLVLPLLALSLAHSVCAQTTEFTYQGVLKINGSPVTGLYDFRVTLYSTATGSGSALAQSAPFIGTNVDNGLFTLPIDLGVSPWLQCSNRWLEIDVRTNGAVAWQTLAPRTLVTPAPYAMGAYSACSVADNAITSQMIAAGQAVKSIDGLTDFVTLSPGANIAFATNGNNIEISATGGLCSPWCLTGNAGTVPGVNFLGTADNRALEIKVNNTRALRIEPTGAAPTFMGGYFQNFASGPGGVVAGGGTSGSINEAAGMYAFVGAGHGSKAGPFSAVVGGAYNVSLSQFSFIGSGLANTNQGTGSAIVGGTNNFVAALADNAFIGGGNNNIVNNTHATIGGGDQNVASSWSTIGGGEANQGSAAFCTVAGGRFNESAGTYSSVGGGYNNHSSGDHAIVAGGYSNFSASTDATVGGGSNNTIQASSDGSVIGGGQSNTIQDNSIWAAISGGAQNGIGTAAGAATIGGGANNFVSPGAGSSTIAGGWQNLVKDNSVYSTIGGGINNVSDGTSSTVGGGYGNSGTGPASVVAGGSGNAASGSYAAVGGGEQNNVNAPQATIAGGNANTIQLNSAAASIGGGSANFIGSSAHGSTIGGGENNTIQNHTGSGFPISTIGGGLWNFIGASAGVSTIGGGEANTNLAVLATISGGAGNNILVGGDYSTIPGGYQNLASGAQSFAAGTKARAVHQGAFVWADSQNADFASTTNNQFSIRAQGGVRLNTDTSLVFGNSSKSALSPDQGGSIELGDPTSPIFTTPYIDFHHGIDVGAQDYNVRIINDGNQILKILRYGSVTPMATFAAGGLTVNGAFVSSSDRNLKENFQRVDPAEVLAKVAALPLTKWNYKEDKASEHIGPMAQDFYAAFGVGPDDKHIATVDADGVALAAIQGLNQKLEDQRAENAELRRKLETMENAIRNLTTK